MTTDASPAPRRVRRWLLRTFTAVAGLAALFFLHGVWDYVEARRLNAYITEHRNPGGLDPSPASSPDEARDLDAAPDARAYYVAAAALTTGEAFQIVRALREGTADAGTVAAAHALLDRNRAPLDLAALAEDRPLRPVGRYDTDARRQAFWFPLARLRRLQSLRALLSAHEGNGAGAVEALTAAARLARLFDLEHFAYDDPARAFVYASQDLSLDVAAAASEPDVTDRDLARLPALLASIDRPALSEHLFVVNRSSVLGEIWPWGSFDEFSTPIWPPALTTDLAAYFARPLQRRRLLNWMQFLGAAVDASRQPMPRMLKTMQGLRAEDYDLVRMSRGRWQISPAGTISMLAGEARDVAFTTTLNHAATVIVAVERYRRAHDGALPQSLDALVPAFADTLPEDPATGEPFKLLLTGDGYVIYGAGANQKDDGGRVAASNAAADRYGHNADDWGISVRLRRK